MGAHVARASRACPERWEKTSLAGVTCWGHQEPLGMSGHHFPVLHINRAAPGQGKPWGRRAADGVLQVNDRAREKIQVSAHLIWFPAVDYSPSAF